MDNHILRDSIQSKFRPNESQSAAHIQNAVHTFAQDTGSANAYAVALSPPIGGYFKGLALQFLAANANTGPSTLAVNGFPAVAVVKAGTNPLSGGEIAAGQIIAVQYDGNFFQIVGGGGSVGSNADLKYLTALRIL